jgi:hypothetical protein
MFSHPPGALHPFVVAVALEARARLAIPTMISAQAPLAKIRSNLKQQFRVIRSHFHSVRAETKTKYFRKAESTI